jgi:hypothetical protein
MTLNLEQFISKSNTVHNSVYDYSDVIYKNYLTKVKINCSVHGTFTKTPDCHIYRRQGCPTCARNQTIEKLSKTTLQFIVESKIIHGNVYDYSKVDYTGIHNNVIITCNTHGEFQQTPNNHIIKQSKCPQCRNETRPFDRLMKQDAFVNKASIIHNGLYDYSKTVYNGCKQKIIIICAKHGEFQQTPSSHLHRKTKCPVCSRSGHSIKSIKWIISNMYDIGYNIQHAQNGGEYLLPGTRIRVDGYCSDTNTVYEFHGNKWHGNPRLYHDTEYCHPYNNNVTAGVLYANTKAREELIKSLGYNLITIWEDEYEQNHQANIIS